MKVSVVMVPEKYVKYYQGYKMQFQEDAHIVFSCGDEPITVMPCKLYLVRPQIDCCGKAILEIEGYSHCLTRLLEDALPNDLIVDYDFKRIFRCDDPSCESLDFYSYMLIQEKDFDNFVMVNDSDEDFYGL